MAAITALAHLGFAHPNDGGLRPEYLFQLSEGSRCKNRLDPAGRRRFDPATLRRHDPATPPRCFSLNRYGLISMLLQSA